MPIDYSKIKIYKIYSHEGDKIYIGKTTKTLLSQRMSKHRDNYKQWKKNKEKYMRSFVLFEEYGVYNCYIELIEAKPCADIDESIKLEGGYIQSLECVNKNIPGRTAKQYREDNKDKIKDKNKKYYEDNKDKIKTKGKEYYEENKDTLKEKGQIYRDDNKDKIKEKDNSYYAKNKELILQKRKAHYLKKKALKEGV